MTGWLSIYNTIHPDDHEPFKSRDIVSNVQRRYASKSAPYVRLSVALSHTHS